MRRGRGSRGREKGDGGFGDGWFIFFEVVELANRVYILCMLDPSRPWLLRLVHMCTAPVNLKHLLSFRFYYKSKLPFLKENTMPLAATFGYLY